MLAQYLKKSGLRPEQVQDFYPTPGTMSTAMFYTGLDPRDMKTVYVARNPHEKAMQRALMQYYIPGNHTLVSEALRKAGREDLIGFGRDCLIPPYLREKKPAKAQDKRAGGNKNAKQTAASKTHGVRNKPESKKHRQR